MSTSEAHPRVVIIEGADGAGKTTFANNLWVNDLIHGVDSRLIHNGPPPKDGSLYYHYRAQILDALWFRDELGVSTYIDRTFLSELIYGPLYRGKSRVFGRQVNGLIRFAHNNGVLFFGVTADTQVRRARIESRGETWDPRQVLIGNLYDNSFQRAASHWNIVDTTSAPITETERH